MQFNRLKAKNKKTELGPVLTIIILTMFIIVLSFICSVFGAGSKITSISNGVLQTTLVSVKNMFSADGIRFFFGNIFSSFTMLEPLLMTIIALIGIGIAEKSGLFKAMFMNIKKFRPGTITFFTLFISIVCSFFGDYAYAFLLPLSAIVYKYAGRNSRLGIITSFIGVSIGMGAGLLLNNIDLVLGTMTQTSASLAVDKNYVYNLVSNLYIMIASTLILSIIGTIIIDNMLSTKFIKKTPLEDEELSISRKGLRVTGVFAIIMFALVLYMILPNLPGSGILLNTTGTTYMEKLMSDTAPFHESAGYIFTLILMICSFVYGKISGNVKNSNEYSIKVADAFDGIGYLFALLFFSSQMVAILNWTNLGTVIVCNLVDFIGSSEMSGILLIITFFIAVIIMGIFVPDTVTKWTLLSPIVIPLFMKSNITPDFTQFIFRAADGCARMLTPFFPYFIVMIAFLQKYNYDEENKITVFGTMKKMLPITLSFVLLWMLILAAWYIIGLPLGPNTFTNL
jgi:aminobenzoyl-glutamate transport protein